MEFLRFLEGIRTPFFDGFFSLITELGGETVFLVVSIVFFWCINKREGYYILLTGLFGTLINQTMKLAFRVPRPEKLDPTFTIVESAREAATGYSFPSGHTQNIAATFGAIALYNKKRRLLVALCAVIILLVSFSRMYLGVHTPLDVSVSLLISAVLVFSFYRLFRTEESFRRAFPYIVVSAVLLSGAFLAYVLLVGGDTGLDAANYESALKNACTLLGCTAGLVLVYFIDGKFTNFKTEARWYSQIIKAALGFGAVLLIKEGLRAPFEFVFGNAYVARSVRYFIIVGFAGCVWPLTFAWFSRLRIGFLEKFSGWLKSRFTKNKA